MEVVFGGVADDFRVGKAEKREIMASELAKVGIALYIDSLASAKSLRYEREINA